MPPLPAKSSGVLLERGAQEARLAPASRADGDRLAAVPAAARVRAVRVLPGFGCEVGAKSTLARHDDSGGRRDRPLRDPAEQRTCAESRRRTAAARPA